MLDLEQLQQAFQAYLLNKTSQIQPEVVAARIPVEVRLNIYRSAYYLRLKDALYEDYPILSGLLGDKKFSALIDDYINAHPSHFRSLRTFGKSLSRFMSQTTLFAEKPWLIEIAQFEWQLTDIFDATNVSAISIEDMAKIEPNKWPILRFKVHPTVSLIKQQWNSVSMLSEFKAHQKKIKPRKEAHIYLLWRSAFEVQYSHLTEDEAFMIEAIQAGKNFSEICEALCQWVEEDQVAIHAATLLKRFVAHGIFSKVLV